MEDKAMVITRCTASLCGRLLSDARQSSEIRSIAGSLLSQYGDQDAKHTSIRVTEIARQILRHNSNIVFKKLAILAIARG